VHGIVAAMHCTVQTSRVQVKGQLPRAEMGARTLDAADSDDMCGMGVCGGCVGPLLSCAGDEGKHVAVGMGVCTQREVDQEESTGPCPALPWQSYSLLTRTDASQPSAQQTTIPLRHLSRGSVPMPVNPVHNKPPSLCAT